MSQSVHVTKPVAVAVAEYVDVIILNLNETDVVLESVKRLKREPWNVIVVDNGSDTEHKEQIRQASGFDLVDLPVNNGASVGRNRGLDRSEAEYVFLLDGDILYIPGTIEALTSLMPDDAGCLGVHNIHSWDGTRHREDANFKWPDNPGKVSDDFPMAWTQYGLFRGDMLRKLRFYDEGVFGQAGNGYEDDWLYHEMKELGYKSYYVPNVMYYHEAHGGQRWLDQKKIDNRNKERKAIFNQRWGKSWHE